MDLTLSSEVKFNEQLCSALARMVVVSGGVTYRDRDLRRLNGPKKSRDVSTGVDKLCTREYRCIKHALRHFQCVCVRGHVGIIYVCVCTSCYGQQSKRRAKPTRSIRYVYVKQIVCSCFRNRPKGFILAHVHRRRVYTCVHFTFRSGPGKANKDVKIECPRGGSVGSMNTPGSRGCKSRFAANRTRLE